MFLAFGVMSLEGHLLAETTACNFAASQGNMFLGVSDQVRQEPDCTTTEDCYSLKFRKKEELCYQCCESKGAAQLRDYRADDLSLCFCICKKPVFS